jgi:hypothetical protein
MLNLLSCYLSARHEYGVNCEPGTIFLRCIHCGRRSSGWAVDARVAATRPVSPVAVPVPRPVQSAAAVARVQPAWMQTAAEAPLGGRVLPFRRSVAR